MMPTPLAMALADLRPSRVHARRWREMSPVERRKTGAPPDRPLVARAGGRWIAFAPLDDCGWDIWDGEFRTFAEAIAYAHAEAVRHG